MLKKISKPQSNTFSCIDMMLTGAKKRRMMAYAAINSLDKGENKKSNVVAFK